MPSLIYSLCRYSFIDDSSDEPLLACGHFLLRPIRILVLSIERQLQQVGTVGAHPVDLPGAAAVGLEGEPFAVRRPSGLFVRAFAGEDAAGAVRQIGDADLE